MNIEEFLGIDLPVIQAPMAGVQDSALTVAVSSAGALGSLPGAMLGVDQLRSELTAIKSQTDKPFNLNFFAMSCPCRMPIVSPDG
jgi:nitronate monooxygenase